MKRSFGCTLKGLILLAVCSVQFPLILTSLCKFVVKMNDLIRKKVYSSLYEN
jgi:hypothetical protein